VGATFQRGEEKGYFLFGGSTVVVYGEPGRWLPNADLLERSAQGIETLLELGAPVAISQRISPA
jgi:phosphatidylserine decarboxylase